jgi:hypothetical protein
MERTGDDGKEGGELTEDRGVKEDFTIHITKRVVVVVELYFIFTIGNTVTAAAATRTVIITTVIISSTFSSLRMTMLWLKLGKVWSLR